MSRLLAIDTTSGACSAALCERAGGPVLAALYQPMDRGHAEALAPMVKQVMQQAAMPMSALGHVAVTTGPGTFTGCRIGLAFARTLGAALGCPVTGVPTLQAIAANVFLAPDAKSEQTIAALMDARRGEVYLQLFAPDGRPQAPARVISAADAVDELSGQRLIMAGTGADVLIGLAPNQAPYWTRASGLDYPDARHVAYLAGQMPVPHAMPEPFYLRAPDAKLPKNKPQLRAGQSGV